MPSPVLAALPLLCGFPSRDQARLERPQLRAELRLAAGDPVVAALTFRLAEGWHLYWKNPGDSGLPPEVAWTLPPGWVAEPLRFPVPRALRQGEAVDFGYEGTVTFLATLRPPTGERSADLVFTAALDWLVCKESCVADRGVLSVALGDLGARIGVLELAGAKSWMPAPSLEGLQVGPAWMKAEGGRWTTVLAFGGPEAPRVEAFFPELPDGFSVLHRDIVLERGRVCIPIRPNRAGARLQRLRGLLSLGPRAVEVDLPITEAP